MPWLGIDPLFIVLGLLAGCVGWLWWLTRRARQLAGRVDTLQQELVQRQGELLAVRGALTALGQEYLHNQQGDRASDDSVSQRLEALEAEQQVLQTRQEQLELRDPDNRSYERAIQLVHRGASIEDLMASCGLSRGEAELVLAVNRSDQQPPE